MTEQLDTLFQWFMEALRLRPVLNVIRDGKSVDLQPYDALQPDDYLQLDDIVELVAPRKVFTAGIQDIGPEIPPEWDIYQAQDTAQVAVTNKQVFGSSLGELYIPRAFGVLVLHITQSGVRLRHSYQLQLFKADILIVVGPANKIDLFGEYMGQLERDISQTDMVTFAFGNVLLMIAAPLVILLS